MARMSENEFFSFHAFDKIDAHLHLNVKNTDVIKAALKHRIRLVTVNVDFPEFGEISAQYEVARAAFKRHPETVRFISSFSMRNWQASDWLANTLTKIERERQQGAVAVKIWKNIGMGVRDGNGQLLFIDDDRLDALFTYLEDHQYPIMMHQGEPKSCWLPLNEISMKYDRLYYKEHPMQHLFHFNDLPSYQQLLDARDRRLQKNPRLKTIQAHLGSMEWNLELIAEFLERFPNAVVDTAARMNYLMLHARNDRQGVRDFMMKYQDRILYATDFFITPQNRKSAAGQLEQLWLRDWEFLSTDNELQTDEFEGTFKGLKIPEPVLKKLYFANAERAFQLTFANRSEILYA